MSERCATNQTAPLPRDDSVDRTPQSVVRFTPLRSAPVTRNAISAAKHGEVFSPLVPERQR
jgi:hypothetical protein